MWQHNYAPVLNSLGWSTVAAAVPIFVLLLLIGVLRKPAWIAGLSGLAAGLVVAIGVYGMPVKLAVSSTLMGAAFGLLPIAWIVYWAVVPYRLTLETGNFEVIKDSIGSLTTDRRLQAMLTAPRPEFLATGEERLAMERIALVEKLAKYGGRSLEFKSRFRA